MQPALPITMWAPIIRGMRSEWIYCPGIRRTRKQAREAYLENWNPEAHADALKRVRFARVTVAVEGAP